jgi:hypothetical protein
LDKGVVSWMMVADGGLGFPSLRHMEVAHAPLTSCLSCHLQAQTGLPNSSPATSRADGGPSRPWQRAWRPSQRLTSEALQLWGQWGRLGRASKGSAGWDGGEL